jgi:hypothetical protein
VAVVEWLQKFLPQESNNTRVAGGLAIAGHIIIALLLVFGASERVEPVSAIAIPVEIAVEKADAPASSPSGPSINNQDDPSGVPAVADADKLAKAPLAKLDVNGVDLPKEAGHDGGDRSLHPAETPLPAADTESASGAESLPSWAMHVAPIGPALPQTTAREAGEDELTALKEEKLECGRKAKRPSPTAGIRNQARVIGFATEAQTLAMIRSSQILADRHINRKRCSGITFRLLS